MNKKFNIHMQVAFDVDISSYDDKIEILPHFTVNVTYNLDDGAKHTITQEFEEYPVWKAVSELSDKENEFIENYLESQKDAWRMDISRYINNNVSINAKNFKETIEMVDGSGNIELPEGYTQVCVMHGCLIQNEEEIKDFEKHFEEKLGVRVKYLETIVTEPDTKNGSVVPETGGRHDVFFVVHGDDVGKFAIPRLALGIRWVEDVLSPVNYSSKIYPDRVAAYKNW